MPAVLTRDDDSLYLDLSGCRGSEFAEAKDKVRDIAGRRWNPTTKLWSVPNTADNAERILKTIQPDANDELLAWLKDQRSHHEESLTNPLPDDAVDPTYAGVLPWAYKRMPYQPEVVNDEKFTGLLPYQRAAVEVMAQRGKALLADDMGLGKTLQTISAIELWRLHHGEADGPKLIAAPASVMGGWARELKRWLPEDRKDSFQIIDARKPDQRHEQVTAAIRDGMYVIVNWEQLRIARGEVKLKGGGKKKYKHMKEPLFQYPDAFALDLPLEELQTYPMQTKLARDYKNVGWLAVVADEVHRAKSRVALQTQGLWRCQGHVMYGLTGTPIMNSPDELWAILRWLYPGEFHERGRAVNAQAYWDFYDDYVDYWEDHFGKKIITGVKNPEALRFVLKDKMIRRTASLLGLKGRKRIYYPVDLNPKQRKLYDEAERSMWLAIEKDATAGNAEAIKIARAAIEGGGKIDLMQIPNGAARFVRLQQVIENSALLGGPDDSAIMDSFEEQIADSRPEQWIGFFRYKDSCELMKARINKRFPDLNVEVYTGDVRPSDRSDIEKEFQAGKVDILVGTIDAMYQGITLTSGHLQFWASRDVVPAKNNQGESRQDRLGQQERVNVYIPQASNTVATGKVQPINRLKESIERTVLPMDKHEEVRQNG